MMNTRQKPSSNETVNESGSEQKRKCNAALRKSASAHSHEATLSLTAQQEELFCSYEYLVSITATKIRLPGERFTAIDVDDLLQIGRIALIRAIQLFDSGRSFKPFAIQLIRNAMLSTIKESMRTAIARAVTGYFDDESEEWIELDSSVKAVVDSLECEYEDSHLLLDILRTR